MINWAHPRSDHRWWPLVAATAHVQHVLVPAGPPASPHAPAVAATMAAHAPTDELRGGRTQSGKNR